MMQPQDRPRLAARRDSGIRHPDAALAAALDDLAAVHAIPRDSSLASRFVRSLLPQGSYYVYPAGLDTRKVLPDLQATPGVRVLGVVDQNAGSLGDFCGFPTVTPESLCRDDNAAPVLVCHGVRERELVDNLRRLGISASRIVPLYGTPEFAEFCQSDTSLAESLAGFVGHIQAVIVRGPRAGLVVEDSALAQVLPPSETFILNAGLAAERIESQLYHSMDTHGSPVLLRTCLEYLRPKIVYVQCNINCFHVAAQVRRFAPWAMVVCELWDLWRTSVGNLRPEHHARLFDLDQRMVDINMACEEYLLAASDLLVSKRGGQSWTAECSGFGAPCLQYFTGVDGARSDDKAQSARTAASLHILFAATMQLPSVLAEFEYLKPTQDHRPMFEALAASGIATVDIFNAAHRDHNDDRAFSDYMERYRDGPIRYHRRVPADELRSLMAKFDYGWIRATPADYTLDYSVVIPASFSTYISADLPIIIHETLDHAAELIARFDAGIIARNGHTQQETLCLIAEQADPARHRAGAQKLRAYMMEQNQSVTAELQSLIDR